MDLFNLTAKITLDTSKYDSGVKKISSSATDLGKEFSAMGKNADDAGRELDSLGNEAGSAGKELDSLGKEADAVGREVSDLGDETASVGGEAGSLGQELGSLGEEAGSLGQEFGSLGEEAASVGQEFGSLGQEAGSVGQELSGLGSEASTSGTTFADLGNAATDFSSDLTESGNTSKTVAGVFAGTLGGNLLVSGIRSAWNSITDSLDSAIGRYDTLNNYVTVMENLGYSTDDAQKSIDGLRDGIDGLPTTLDGIVNWQQQFTALTGDISYSTDLTLALNDAALAAGQGQETASAATQAWYNIIANGTPTMVYWKQLNQDMPASLDMLAKSMLGAEADAWTLFDAWQEGTVTTEQVTDAVIALDSDGGEAYASFSQQALDATAGIATSQEKLSTAITRGVADTIQAYDDWAEDNSMPTISEMIGKIQGLVDDLFGAISDHFPEIAGAFDALVPFVKELWDWFNQAFGWVLDNLPEIVQWIEKLIPVIAAVGAAFVAAKIVAQISEMSSAISSFASGPAGWVIIAIVGIVTALITLYQQNEDFRNFVDKCWQVIQQVFEVCGQAIQIAIELVKTIIETLKTTVETVAGAIQTAWNAVKTAFETVGNAIGIAIGAVQTAIEAVGNAFEKVGGVFQTIWGGIKQVGENVGSAFKGIGEDCEGTLSNMQQAWQEHGGGITGIASALWEGCKGLFNTGFNFIDNLTGGKLGNIKDKFVDKMGDIKDKVSDGLGKVKGFFTDNLGDAFTTVKDKMGDIAEKFRSKMKDASDWVSEKIEDIKGFFNFDWSLPDLKLPHFSFSGEFSLNPLSVPTLSVDWYAKAMNDGVILNGATIFGASGGTLLGGGEVGSEVVVGTDSLMGMIESASGNAEVAEKMDYWCGAMYGLMSRYLPEFENMQICLDTGATVGGLAPAMNKKLGTLSTKEARR